MLQPGFEPLYEMLFLYIYMYQPGTSPKYACILPVLEPQVA